MPRPDVLTRLAGALVTVSPGGAQQNRFDSSTTARPSSGDSSLSGYIAQVAIRLQRF